MLDNGKLNFKSYVVYKEKDGASLIKQVNKEPNYVYLNENGDYL